MYSLLLDIDELKQLSQDGQHLFTTIVGALDIVTRPEVERRHQNLARKPGSIRTKYVK